MQGKKLLCLVANGLITLSFSASALASMSVPEGWYLEGNVGSTKLTDKTYPGSSSTSGIGANVNLGYKFMPYFAAEFGYTRYANTSIKDQFSTKAATDRHYSYDLAGKAILPIVASGFEAFAKLGMERISSRLNIDNSAAANNIALTSSRHSDTGLYWGVGGQYYFMPELAAVVQWAQARGSSSSGTLDLLSAGVSFIFN